MDGRELWWVLLWAVVALLCVIASLSERKWSARKRARRLQGRWRDEDREQAWAEGLARWRRERKWKQEERL